MKLIAQKTVRLIELHKQLEENKALYKEFDMLLNEFVQAGVFESKNKRFLLKIKDNFLNKNTVFKATFYRRYDLEVIKKGALFESTK